MLKKGILSQEEIDALLRISSAMNKDETVEDNLRSAKKKDKTPSDKGVYMVNLTVHSSLVTKATTIKEYLNWQVGDVLPLGELPLATVDVARTPLFTATIDRYIDKRALTLIARINDG